MATKVPRRIASSVWIALVVLAAASPASYADTILFIGNSFIYGALSPIEHYRPDSVSDLNGSNIGGVPALFKTFTDEAGLYFDVSLETRGSSDFEFHYSEKRALIDRPWDHVILQGYSTLDSKAPGDPALFVEYAAKLAAMLRAKNPRVEVRLDATWSRADQTYVPTGHWFGRSIAAMETDVRAACDQALAASANIRAVVPVGQAWNRAIESGVAAANPYVESRGDAVNLWAADHYHASTFGYYLETLVIFGSVTGRDPRSLGGKESAAAELGIPSALVEVLERLAFETLDAETHSGK